jgi:hypothetical protein
MYLRSLTLSLAIAEALEIYPSIQGIVANACHNTNGYTRTPAGMTSKNGLLNLDRPSWLPGADTPAM